MTQIKRSTKTLVFALAAAIGVSSLSGCIGLAATGVAAGVMAVTDRRTLGAQTDDQSIEIKAFSKVQEALKNPGGVSVTSYNRRVLLTGQVLDAAAKQSAEKAVAGIDGVKQIHNELTVSGRAGVGTNAADTVTTTRIKAAFVEAKDVQANTIKVVTEQGTAYLMGLVTPDEANRASQVASRVGGVQRVVTVFEVVSGDELKRIEATAGR